MLAFSKLGMNPEASVQIRMVLSNRKRYRRALALGIALPTEIGL